MKTQELHATTADTQPHASKLCTGPVGLWLVKCCCGWATSALYLENEELAEVKALALAHRVGTVHETRQNGKEPGA